MDSMNLIVWQWQEDGKNQRLGQFFVNNFIKHPWPELYFEEDTNKAMTKIRTWLVRYQYIDSLPKKVI